MPCPTCGHSMAMLSREPGIALHLCGRCGTVVRHGPAEHVDVYVPKLVERCQRFEAACITPTFMDLYWRPFGIQESIHPPEGRP